MVSACAKCGKIKQVHLCRESKELLCQNCYRLENREICFLCGKLKPVHGYDYSGKVFCAHCRKNVFPDKKICLKCQKIKRMGRENAICPNCERRESKNIVLKRQPA